jgi:hypothetical protein
VESAPATHPGAESVMAREAFRYTTARKEATRDRRNREAKRLHREDPASHERVRGDHARGTGRELLRVPPDQGVEVLPGGLPHLADVGRLAGAARCEERQGHRGAGGRGRARATSA